MSIAIEKEDQINSDLLLPSHINLPSWKLISIVMIFLIFITSLFFDNAKGNIQLSLVLHILTGSLSYSLLRMVMSFFYKPSESEPPDGAKVSVVIPSFNEDANSVVNSIKALTLQSITLHEIIFIDDGSKSLEAYKRVKQFANIFNGSKMNKTKIIVHRFTENKGKRAAQEWGFYNATGDYIMLYDSDGVIGTDTVKELLRPFVDKKVYAVCGHINARNAKQNLWTKLQDIMYESAFRVGRASQSLTGDVVVCSGANSMFLREKILPNMEEFMDETFMGINVFVGDDRKLTEIMLREGGKVKYQSTAVCLTDVPVTLKSFFKQQVRWNKSFIIGTLTSLTFAWKRPMLLLWLLAESFVWLAFAISSLITMFIHLKSFVLVMMLYSVVYLILSTLALNSFYVFKNPILFLFSPFYGFVRGLLIFPIRIWALLTISKTKWGTR